MLKVLQIKRSVNLYEFKKSNGWNSTGYPTKSINWYEDDLIPELKKAYVMAVLRPERRF